MSKYAITWFEFKFNPHTEFHFFGLLDLPVKQWRPMANTAEIGYRSLLKI